MLKLEDLKKDALVRGIQAEEIVRIIQVERVGFEAEWLMSGLLLRTRQMFHACFAQTSLPKRESLVERNKQNSGLGWVNMKRLA